MTKKKMKKSSESPSSFSLLPYDVAVNCLARISRIHHPTLSLVSKAFRSLLSSPELYATRCHIGKTEELLYVCLNLDKYYTRWFTVVQFPNQLKLVPVSSFPSSIRNSSHSTVLSVGSEIYVIGGFFKRKRSKSVYVLDCIHHRWRQLPDMLVYRKSPAADVIDGKIYVIGGFRYKKSKHWEHWGEIYDPKTQKWEALPRKTLDLTTQTSLVPDYLIMGGKMYEIDSLIKLGDDCDVCLVEVEQNKLCPIWVSSGSLFWYDPIDGLGNQWNRVKGLPNSIYFTSMSGGGRRLTVWWKSLVVSDPPGARFEVDCKHDIWCGEVSFERRGVGNLHGLLKSAKEFVLEGWENSTSYSFLHSLTVTL